MRNPTTNLTQSSGLGGRANGKEQRMDAISMLKEDHKSVEQLFKRFEKAGDRAYVEKRDLVDRIIEALSVHAAIEEQLFYPVARATVPDTDDVVLESLEEHHIVKWVLSELESMTPEDERFDAKVTVLIENVRHHVEEEETEFFPKVRDELGRTALGELGAALATARKAAPTHPHPRLPDTPPGNLVVGIMTGVADRIGDAVSGLAQGSVTAVGDLLATVLRRRKPRVSPKGSNLARSTATKVRSSVSDATEAAIEATRNAKRTSEATVKRAARITETTGSAAKAGAKRTARTAKSGSTRTARAAKAGAKGTATSARTSTKRVVTTAKGGATHAGRTAREAATSTATTAKRSASRTASTATRAARAA